MERDRTKYKVAVGARRKRLSDIMLLCSSSTTAISSDNTCFVSERKANQIRSLLSDDIAVVADTEKHANSRLSSISFTTDIFSDNNFPKHQLWSQDLTLCN
jgi:hypothetical protein